MEKQTGDKLALVIKDGAFTNEQIQQFKKDWDETPMSIEPLIPVIEVTHVGVTLICQNETGKLDTKYFETDTLLSATRIMNTFKPKRGFELVKTIIENVRVLL